MAIKFTVSEWIDATPARVFAVSSDIRNAGDWMNGLVRIEMLEGEGFEVGLRWREVRKMYGKEAAEEFEVKSCEPPNRFLIYVDGSKGSTGKGEYFFDHTLSEDNGGTLFRVDAVIDGMGLMGKILGPILGKAFRKGMEKDFRAMKEHIESKPA